MTQVSSTGISASVGNYITSPLHTYGGSGEGRQSENKKRMLEDFLNTEHRAICLKILEKYKLLPYFGLNESDCMDANYIDCYKLEAISMIENEIANYICKILKEIADSPLFERKEDRSNQEKIRSMRNNLKEFVEDAIRSDLKKNNDIQKTIAKNISTYDSSDKKVVQVFHPMKFDIEDETNALTPLFLSAIGNETT